MLMRSQGTPPWNLELQVVGPRSTDALEITDIKTSPTRILVPIPSALDKEGGTFDVDLGRLNGLMFDETRLMHSISERCG